MCCDVMLAGCCATSMVSMHAGQHRPAEHLPWRLADTAPQRWLSRAQVAPKQSSRMTFVDAMAPHGRGTPSAAHAALEPLAAPRFIVDHVRSTLSCALGCHPDGYVQTPRTVTDASARTRSAPKT